MLNLSYRWLIIAVKMRIFDHSLLAHHINLAYESFYSVIIDSVRSYFNQDDGDGSMKMASDSST